ncbi:MAG: ATP-binding protein [Actinomycetes bacterium]
MSLRRGPALARVCPTLVGRDDQLALALRRWSAAATRREGHILLVSGEAGIGKTRLLGELVDHVGDARLITIAAFPRETLVPGGALLNLADDVARGGDADRAERLRTLLTSEPATASEAERRRWERALAEIIGGLLEGAPTLLLVEDAHWADEVTLEVIARLVPVIRSSPCLTVVTMRTDEARTGAVLAPWRARLLAQRFAEEIRLDRLDAVALERMAESILGRTPDGTLLAALGERSDGIPLHVEELLADGLETLPESIADAVRSRVGSLPRPMRDILSAASVIGRSFDPALLEGVAMATRADVALALAELVEQRLVSQAPGDGDFVFRHALLCDVVYRDLPWGRRRDLHLAVARESTSRALAPGMISDHLERAGAAREAHAVALAGAQDAVRRAAHTEAIELLRRAQRTTPDDLAPEQRARLLAVLGSELLAADRPAEADEALAEAVEARRAVGDEVGAAALIPDLMAARHLEGVDPGTRSALAIDAIRRLDDRDARGDAPARARAGLFAALASVAMLERRLDSASEHAARARAALESCGVAEGQPDPVSLDLDITLGSVRVFEGRSAEGWGLLESAAQRAEAVGDERSACRAHRMLGSAASVLLDYERAHRSIERGLAVTARAERWNDHFYLLAHSAHVAWATGHAAEAEALAHRAIAAGGGITTAITAHQVLGYLALDRGDGARAREELDRALALGEATAELQRLSPSWWGLAELALVEGDPRRAAGLCERALTASEEMRDAAYLLPFVVTGVRALLASARPGAAEQWLLRCDALLRARALPGTLVALDHARGLLDVAHGDVDSARALLAAALDGWSAVARVREAAAAEADLARLSGPAVDRSASLETPLEPSPLSSRELDVARRVARGETNRQIAAALTIAPKTVSAHIEHILAKLGASRRAEIAAWIARREPRASDSTAEATRPFVPAPTAAT